MQLGEVSLNRIYSGCSIWCYRQLRPRRRGREIQERPGWVQDRPQDVGGNGPTFVPASSVLLLCHSQRVDLSPRCWYVQVHWNR